MNEDQWWDVALTRGAGENRPPTVASIPAPIARVLMECGFNRARVTLTETGFHYQPYVSEDHSRPGYGLVNPKWADKA